MSPAWPRLHRRYSSLRQKSNRVARPAHAPAAALPPAGSGSGGAGADRSRATKKGDPKAAPCRKGRSRMQDAAAATGQRFENWKLRRALARPYFLRSTTRLSRVRKPSFFSAGRSSGS